MKSLLVGVALASTALAAPAFARDGAAYFELDGGVMKLQDIKFDVGAVDNAARIKPRNYGYDFGGIVGYDFGGFRVEGEVGYRGADVRRVSNIVRIPTTGLLVGQSTIGSNRAAGDAKNLSFMLNALGDFGPDDGLQFFAGAGVGYSKTDIDASVNAVGPGFVNDDDWAFSWQLLAGVRAPLSDNIDVGVKYRYFNASNVKLNDTYGRRLEGDWRSHSLLGTFTVNFGGSEPMPEPVAAPPPPPPPPVYTPPPPPPPPPAPEPVTKPAERG